MFVSNREFRNFCFVFGTLAVVSYAVRCYVRLKILNFFGWDDGTMLVALVSEIQVPKCLSFCL